MATITAAKFAEILSIIPLLSTAQAAMVLDALHEERLKKALTKATYEIHLNGLLGSPSHINRYLVGKLRKFYPTQYTIWIPSLQHPKIAHVIVNDPTVFEELLRTLSDQLKSTSITVQPYKKDQKRRAAPAAVDDVSAAVGDGFHGQLIPVPHEVQENVKTLLCESPISGEKFQSIYRKRFGHVIPYKSYGYEKLTHMLVSIGVISIPFTGGVGPNTFHPAEDWHL